MRDMVQRRHIWLLLATLVVAFIVIPVLDVPTREDPKRWQAFWVQLVVSQALLGGVYVVSAHRWMRSLILACLVPALAIALLIALKVIPTESSDDWQHLTTVLDVIGFTLVAIAMTRHLMRETKVTMTTIGSALAVYILFGILWALVYALAEHSNPDVFGGLSKAIETGLQAEGVRTPLKTLLYFSFTTLTTLGYGDIVPVHPVVRSLAVLEAATGQVYIAILVARLVAIHTMISLERRGDYEG